jgi:hypothetical protein
MRWMHGRYAEIALVEGLAFLYHFPSGAVCAHFLEGFKAMQYGAIRQQDDTCRSLDEIRQNYADCKRHNKAENYRIALATYREEQNKPRAFNTAPFPPHNPWYGPDTWRGIYFSDALAKIVTVNFDFTEIGHSA